ncbi:DNA alkylation repair protein [Arthrobacter sp. PsM3]|uniref:DNA alkylation repair protein n=1 Tax=Arthrobacter sp. PsM3 TaxID=3030531 RepID=UPI00263AA089|nr:DNA alkylation repair protein [Arthrobacter sp. PsM3]MDN4644558.1 DNA alkylation repair protein [Arthrobacter sp. PsM3]
MGVMNELINPRVVRSLERILAAAAPGGGFSHLAGTAAQLEELSLRERTDLLSRALLSDLPGNYAAAAVIFRRALADPDFTGWMIWPVTETAATLALISPEPHDFEDCLSLLAELTPRLTAEFAIRRLLAADLDRALAVIQDWTSDPDWHVRRLASEGTRAYLPWAIRVPEITERPAATLSILDALYRDPVEDVRRSVANHLNDLARHAPDEVVATAARWVAAPDANTARVVRHGLRTLLKKAHPGALELLGFPPASLAVTPPRLDRTVVELPGELAFDFEVTNNGPAEARLAVDYVVHYAKANGCRAEKVFKLGTAVLGPGESRRFSKRHAFRQMTTRVHHAGAHVLEPQVNGVRFAPAEFLVRTDAAEAPPADLTGP